MACFLDLENWPPESMRYSIAGTSVGRFNSPLAGSDGEDLLESAMLSPRIIDGQMIV